ncbi:MAG: DUF4031 domain-containing protein [Methylomonas sp.]|jgi:hypothetical protein
MAVYVDNELIEWHGQLWCHLVADSLEELHKFAKKLGLRKSWFQSQSAYPHYDVTKNMRSKALALGAIESDRATIIWSAKKLQAEMKNPTGTLDIFSTFAALPVSDGTANDVSITPWKP